MKKNNSAELFETHFQRPAIHPDEIFAGMEVKGINDMGAGRGQALADIRVAPRNQLRPLSDITYANVSLQLYVAPPNNGTRITVSQSPFSYFSSLCALRDWACNLNEDLSAAVSGALSGLHFRLGVGRGWEYGPYSESGIANLTGWVSPEIMGEVLANELASSLKR